MHSPRAKGVSLAPLNAISSNLSVGHCLTVAVRWLAHTHTHTRESSYPWGCADLLTQPAASAVEKVESPSSFADCLSFSPLADTRVALEGASGRTDYSPTSRMRNERDNFHRSSWFLL